MNRRTFLPQLAAWTIPVPGFERSQAKVQPIKARALQKGDTVGVITPSSSITRDNYEKLLSNLEKLGLNPQYSENMRVKKGFLAGTDEQRIADIHAMFEAPEIKGIICARGGYGAQRLLPGINFNLIQKNPKLFIGYSDITALLLAIYKQTGLICFHGPNGDSEFSDFSLQQFQQLIFENKAGTLAVSDPSLPPEFKDSWKVIRPGLVHGELIGGNLTLISTLMGTPYEPDFSGKIVFLEDIGESPYRVDRMLTQLLISGKLQKAHGIALGIFTDCEEKADDPDFPDTFSLAEIIQERLGKLNIPAAYGFPFGHIPYNGILPMGIRAVMDTANGQIRLLEQPFQ